MRKISLFAIVFLLMLAAGSISAFAADCGDKHKTEKACCPDKMDPVCNMDIKDTKKAFKYEYEGHTYYFCSEACREAFTKDPAKYAADCCAGKIYCPVSGEEIKDKDKAVTAEYKGNTIYFCCQQCKETFAKDPEKYLKKHSKKMKMMDKKKCGEHSDSADKEGEQD